MVPKSLFFSFLDIFYVQSCKVFVTLHSKYFLKGLTWAIFSGERLEPPSDGLRRRFAIRFPSRKFFQTTLQTEGSLTTSI
jgi:hypothetical protein